MKNQNKPYMTEAEVINHLLSQHPMINDENYDFYKKTISDMVKRMASDATLIESPTFEDEKDNGVDVSIVWDKADEIRGGDYCHDLIYMSNFPIDDCDILTFDEGYVNHDVICFIVNKKEYWYKGEEISEYAWHKLGYDEYEWDEE